MPAERVSMRRVREILRLKYEAGASDRAIARSVGVARSTARLCLDRVAAAGLTWPLPEGLTDGALQPVDKIAGCAQYRKILGLKASYDATCCIVHEAAAF